MQSLFGHSSLLHLDSVLLFLSPAGLETFISTAKKLPCSDLYDVVEGYIKISMECTEIFRLLEGEKHSESEVNLPSRITADRSRGFGKLKLHSHFCAGDADF